MGFHTRVLIRLIYPLFIIQFSFSFSSLQEQRANLETAHEQVKKLKDDAKELTDWMDGMNNEYLAKDVIIQDAAEMNSRLKQLKVSDIQGFI